MLRALELNPDLSIAHNLYAMIQVEQGHADDAMIRLLRRARTSGNDPELFAALSHACRYCGLLDASLAAHRRARHFDPHIPTTVTQTYFLSATTEAPLLPAPMVTTTPPAACLAMLDRTDEGPGYSSKAGTDGHLAARIAASGRLASLP